MSVKLIHFLTCLVASLWGKIGVLSPLERHKGHRPVLQPGRSFVQAVKSGSAWLQHKPAAPIETVLRYPTGFT